MAIVYPVLLQKNVLAVYKIANLSYALTQDKRYWQWNNLIIGGQVEPDYLSFKYFQRHQGPNL